MPSYEFKWFTPGEGIAREVISADIQRYLGRDALVKPGVGVDEYDGVDGYWIAAYRNLTSEMIQDLKNTTYQWRLQGGVYKDSDVYKRGQGIPTQPAPAAPANPAYPPSRDPRSNPRYPHGAQQYYEQTSYGGYGQQQPAYPYGQQQQPAYPYGQYGTNPQPSSYIHTPGQYETTGEQATQGQRDPRTMMYGLQTTTQDRPDPRQDPRYAAWYAAHYGTAQPTQDQYAPSSTIQYDQYGRPIRRQE